MRNTNKIIQYFKGQQWIKLNSSKFSLLSLGVFLCFILACPQVEFNRSVELTKVEEPNGGEVGEGEAGEGEAGEAGEEGEEGEGEESFSCDNVGDEYNSSGAGTEAGPYLICNEDQLIHLSENSSGWGSYFLQMQDISLHNYSLINRTIGTIGIPFTGTYDGNNTELVRFSINQLSSYKGFFGAIENATIQNLTLDTVTINGTSKVGGLVGYMENSLISNCAVLNLVFDTTSGGVGGLVGYAISSAIQDSYTVNIDIENAGGIGVGGLVGWLEDGSVLRSYSRSGTVIGGLNVGGLVGRVEGTSSIGESFSNVTVSAFNRYGGGLVGWLWDDATIDNSYSLGDVNGIDPNSGLDGGTDIAGFVHSGSSTATISDCYSTGEVSGSASINGFANSDVIFSNSFWLQDSILEINSGVISGAGTVVDDPSLKEVSTFSGWDFESKWTIDEGNSYPTLSWQE